MTNIVYFTVVCLAFVSCRSPHDLTKRKYTAGTYRDFNFHREKSEKHTSVDSMTTSAPTSLLSKVKESLLPSLEELNITDISANPSAMLSTNYPMIAEKIDSAFARELRKDSTWRTDSLPEVIITALSSQAMVGLGTVGGLATIANPDLIWFTIVPMIGIPFFLLISLIAAAVAFGKINSGEIDARYKKWMRLWALCLVVNILLGSIVLMHFTGL